MKIYKDLVQGSEEWLQARCGLLTASTMSLIVTPTLKIASNDKERAHLYELIAQRVTQYIEPSYINDNMLRGHEDEIEARIKYSEKYGAVEEVGFITEDKWGFTVGYSPDGLVGDDGLIEIKSKKQKLQTEVIIKNEVPTEHVIQIQTGLLVSGRKWCDFISYSGGMPMFIKRMYADDVIQARILDAATIFEDKILADIEVYKANSAGLIMTERVSYEDITV